MTAPAKRWDAAVAHLHGVLAAEAGRKPTSKADLLLDGGWAWRVLPDGVVVSMRTAGLEKGSWRYEIRIAAAEPIVEWDGRLGEIVRELQLRVSDGDRICPFPGALWWKMRPQARDEGKLAARFVSLQTGEIQPHDRWASTETTT